MVPLSIDSRHTSEPLAFLLDVNEILIGTPTLRVATRRILDALERHDDITRSSVTLVVDEGSPLRIGMTSDDHIAARVIDTNRPAIVPPIACVPITLKRKPAGALTVEMPSAIALGAIAAVPSYFALVWRAKTDLDDSLDVIAAHGVGGTVGALLTGVLQNKR